MIDMTKRRFLGTGAACLAFGVPWWLSTGHMSAMGLERGLTKEFSQFSDLLHYSEKTAISSRLTKLSSSLQAFISLQKGDHGYKKHGTVILAQAKDVLSLSLPLVGAGTASRVSAQITALKNDLS